MSFIKPFTFEMFPMTSMCVKCISVTGSTERPCEIKIHRFLEQSTCPLNHMRDFENHESKAYIGCASVRYSFTQALPYQLLYTALPIHVIATTQLLLFLS